jgi:uncharacterized damage-inducible protein DinB
MEFGLYLESGPRRRKTMVHVLDLLGCVAVGPTTEEGVAAAPLAIRQFSAFVRRAGEQAPDPDPVEIRIVEHITEGTWLGNGSPYIMFGPDFEPVTQPLLDRYLNRFAAMRGAVTDWAEAQSAASLDADPVGGGRTARAVLLHVLGATGGYLAAGLGSASGFSHVHTQAERGELPLAEALKLGGELALARARRSSAQQRQQVMQKSHGPRTFHQTLRRMLEHEWEHLAELARRPGGPKLSG